MQVRNRSSLAIALLLLSSSGALGLMVHDAEVGGPDAATLQPGDEVRLRGVLAPVREAESPTGGVASWMETDAWAGTVIVTADHRLPDDGTWVVQGKVLWIGPAADGDLLVIEALDVTEPILFS